MKIETILLMYLVVGVIQVYFSFKSNLKSDAFYELTSKLHNIREREHALLLKQWEDGKVERIEKALHDAEVRSFRIETLKRAQAAIDKEFKSKD